MEGMGHPFPPKRTLPWSHQGPHGSPSISPAQGSPQRALPVQVAMVEAGDTGRYTCMAENPAGSAEKHFALAVQGEASPLPWSLIDSPPPLPPPTGVCCGSGAA